MADDPIDINAYRAEREAESWKDDLILKGKTPAGNEANVARAFCHCPLFAGRIAFNKRSWMPIQLERTPAGPAGDWSDAHTSRAAIWLQENGVPASLKAVDNALIAVARQNELDPLEDWLMALEWDGQERIGTWLRDYAQADDTVANSIMGSKWLIGAAARALKPGCRMDVMLVLEGPQGIKKSTLVKVLGGEYTAENLPDFHSKDAMQVAGTKWIIELSELAAIKRSDMEHVKAFISRLEDTFRAPYGRFHVTQKRRCALIGNLNPDGNGYLQDTTGNRRFWPVKVGPVDIDALKKDRAQIWAEAVYCFLRGDHWWLNSEETQIVAGEQHSRMAEDPWAQAIEQYATSRVGTFSTTDIAVEALGMKIGEVNKSISTRIGIMLNSIGFERKKLREGNKLSWVYGRAKSD